MSYHTNGKMSIYLRGDTREIIGPVEPRGVSKRLASIVSRYNDMVNDLMPTFAAEEWQLIFDCNRRYRYEDPAEKFWINVATFGREAAHKYNVDVESLVIRLRGLERFELIAMQEAAIKYWQKKGMRLSAAGVPVA